MGWQWPWQVLLRQEVGVPVFSIVAYKAISTGSRSLSRPWTRHAGPWGYSQPLSPTWLSPPAQPTLRFCQPALSPSPLSTLHGLDSTWHFLEGGPGSGRAVDNWTTLRLWTVQLFRLEGSGHHHHMMFLFLRVQIQTTTSTSQRGVFPWIYYYMIYDSRFIIWYIICSLINWSLVSLHVKAAWLWARHGWQQKAAPNGLTISDMQTPNCQRPAAVPCQRFFHWFGGSESEGRVVLRVVRTPRIILSLSALKSYLLTSNFPPRNTAPIKRKHSHKSLFCFHVASKTS